MAELRAADVGVIRELLKIKLSPTEKELTAQIGRSISGIKKIVTKFRASFLDETVSAEGLANTINASRPKKIQVPPLSIDTKVDQFAGLPPKMLAKKLAHTPRAEINGSDNLRLYQNRSLSADFTRKHIQTLPRIDGNPLSMLHSHENMREPMIGSLAVFVYKGIEPSQICRVLSYKIENNEKYYLIAFLQKDTTPFFVLSDYLFQLKTNVTFSLDNGSDWDKYVEEHDITVDWLLEHIYSAAQSIVFNIAYILFPQDLVEKSVCNPTPEIRQKVLFQARTFGALLIVCYIAGKWDISKDKLQIIIDTIMKINISNYASTQLIIDGIDKSVRSLLQLPEKSN